MRSTVTADRPRGVEQVDQLGVGPLQCLGGQPGPVEVGFPLGGAGVELVEPGDERGTQVGVAEQREHSRHALQQRVDLGGQLGGVGQCVGDDRRVEQTDQVD